MSSSADAAATEEARDYLAASTERLSASGIPLAEAVRTVVQPLARNPATIRELAEEIEGNKVMVLNRGRIITTWGDPGNWPKTGRIIRVWDADSAERLTQDILTLLAEPRLELVRNIHGKWELTENFSPYERYVLLASDGKPLTHLRLREKETRASRTKINEARMLLLDAARLTREAGVQSQEVTEFFTGLQRMLTSDNVFEQKPRGSRPRVITPDQPKDVKPLEEQGVSLAGGVLYFKRHWRPEDMHSCVKCKKPKPMCREFYEVYREASNGIWYWRRDCKTCRKTQKGLRGKLYLEADNIKLYITQYTAEHGEPPTVKQVCEGTGSHFRTVRAAWKMFTEEDELFPLLPKARREYLKEAGYEV